VRHYIARDVDRAAAGGPLDFRVYPTNKEILAAFINDPLIGPPGAQIAYSTFGYTLASLVLEAAAGQPFPSL
jgi:CubicO group peptidase (beta-lactamase class C family)